jgi:hypothetical protein
MCAAATSAAAEMAAAAEVAATAAMAAAARMRSSSAATASTATSVRSRVSSTRESGRQSNDGTDFEFRDFEFRHGTLEHLQVAFSVEPLKRMLIQPARGAKVPSVVTKAVYCSARSSSFDGA